MEKYGRCWNFSKFQVINWWKIIKMDDIWSFNLIMEINRSLKGFLTASMTQLMNNHK